MQALLTLFTKEDKKEKKELTDYQKTNFPNANLSFIEMVL